MEEISTRADRKEGGKQDYVVEKVLKTETSRGQSQYPRGEGLSAKMIAARSSPHQ